MDERPAEAQREKEAGNAAYRKLFLETAVGHYTRGASLDHRDISFLTNRAAAYLLMGKYNKLVARALSRKASALLKLAGCAGDYAPAIRALQQSLAEHYSEETRAKLDEAESARKELEEQERLDQEAADHHREKRRWTGEEDGHRYKTCWLPLLAKHTQAAVVDGLLVVPLDCEWIWHCHRLNPAQYIKDCKRLYGRILDNVNVESSIGTKSKHQAEKVWTELYPREPFELEHTTPSDNSIYANTGASGDISYDLVSAVKRQSSFCYQIFIITHGYLPFKFKRKQFPIRLSFAMTINKAQCQTISNVGIYLPEPVFSHGQFYIALSRGVSRQTTRILAKPKKKVDGKSTKNIVYKDVLAW